MKNFVLFVFLGFFSSNLIAQKTYWKKKFNNGTLYVSVNKTNGKHGHHIREYFTGTSEGTLVAFKKSNYSNKYKLQTKRGWSGKSYFYFEDSYMFYRNNKMGKTLKLTRISRSDVPRYIREDAYYKRFYVRD